PLTSITNFDTITSCSNNQLSSYDSKKTCSKTRSTFSQFSQQKHLLDLTSFFRFSHYENPAILYQLLYPYSRRLHSVEHHVVYLYERIHPTYHLFLLNHNVFLTLYDNALIKIGAKKRLHLALELIHI